VPFKVPRVAALSFAALGSATRGAFFSFLANLSTSSDWCTLCAHHGKPRLVGIAVSIHFNSQFSNLKLIST
jgi:hypothetical protein